jgi:hypothetical protein
MGILSDNKQPDVASRDQVSRMAGQIQALKSRNLKLEHENQKLRDSRPRRQNMSVSGSTMILTDTLQQNGRQYNCTRSIEFKDAFKALLPLIRPLMNISKAAVLGQDVERHTEKHIIDSNGRITKELDRDESGSVLHMPNDRDRVNAILEVLTSNPDTRDALILIGRTLRDSKEEIAMRAETLANSKTPFAKDSNQDFDFDL